jgi:class 3 adenylate cyclase
MVPRISLKHILAPASDAVTVMESLLESLQAKVFVEDAAQKLLLGDPTVPTINTVPILFNGVTIGTVQGDDKTPLIASLIQEWVNREADKKKLGNEVLVLYQEVNQMFNFSEKLAASIGQHSIATITLQEAGRLIKSDSGIIILWDEGQKKLEVTTSGKHVFDEVKLSSHRDLLWNIAREGQSDIMGDLAPLKAAGILNDEVHALMYASLKVKHRVMGAIIVSNTAEIQYSAADLKFLVTIALQSASAIESAFLYEQNIREAKEREEAMRRVYDVTNKFVPHEFIKSLGRDVITDVQLGDQVEKIVTVLFSDIRDYTTLSEQMTPEENFHFVCSFNERIGPIIRQNKGFINQYLGDAIMAIFPGSPADALAASIEMHNAVEVLNQERALEQKAPIRIGVGMYTGPLIMGITGDHERLDATTISDTVNTASRLEGLTKFYKTGILLGKSSVDNLPQQHPFHLRHLGQVQLKGKMEAISIFECFNGVVAGQENKKLHTQSVFQAAMRDYGNKAFSEAIAQFQSVVDADPEDHTASYFLKKANDYLIQGIPENWTGIEEMHMK